jgi:hypothetical protein
MNKILLTIKGPVFVLFQNFDNLQRIQVRKVYKNKIV